MRYLIIGLGIYGSNLARDLTEMGHEVIGVDCNQTNVDEIKDYISTVYMVDTTEETSLSVLPLRNVDVVIVAIGENFGASVRTVALLKKSGVKCLYARAIDKLHEAILEGSAYSVSSPPNSMQHSTLPTRWSLERAYSRWKSTARTI